MRLADAPDFLTVDEAAEILRTRRTATYAAIERGQVPAIRVGRKLRVPRVALERVLNGDSDMTQKPQRGAEVS